jgi:hypothetical protein
MNAATYALRDGAILAVVACGLLAITLRLRPRLFLSDLPEPLRREMPPKTRAETVQSAIVGVLLIGWVLGCLIVSTAAAEERLGGSALRLALHAFAVGMVFNVADWLVLDELWLGWTRPDWLARAVGSPTPPPFDHAKHRRDFLKGTLVFAVLGAIIGGAVAVM